MIHELTKKLRESRGGREFTIVSQEEDKIIRAWLEEKAEELKEKRSHGGKTQGIILFNEIDQILCLTEKTLEEKFEEFIKGYKIRGLDGGNRSWLSEQLANIAEEHYRVNHGTN